MWKRCYNHKINEQNQQNDMIVRKFEASHYFRC